MRKSRRGALILASVAALAVAGPALASQARFIHSLSAALIGRQGAFAGDAPNAGRALARLPLIEAPARKKGSAMVVFYSGDGGWAKAAAAIAGGLAEAGDPTVGIDSLRYFWAGRTPQAAAADLAAVIAQYRTVWGRDQVVLAGYSFGADALPVIWPQLPMETRRQVRAVVLIGASASAEMVVRPRSWLDLKAKDAIPLRPLLARMGDVRTACIYGASDKVSACPMLLPKAQLSTLQGGHHFNGDYHAVDEAVLKAAGL